MIWLRLWQDRLYHLFSRVSHKTGGALLNVIATTLANEGCGCCSVSLRAYSCVVCSLLAGSQRPEDASAVQAPDAVCQRALL